MDIFKTSIYLSQINTKLTLPTYFTDNRMLIEHMLYGSKRSRNIVNILNLNAYEKKMCPSIFDILFIVRKMTIVNLY